MRVHIGRTARFAAHPCDHRPCHARFPIIDSHRHVWDQTRLKYSAFDGHPLYGQPCHVEDYQRDCSDYQVEAMVYLECYADFWPGGGQYIEEVSFVEEEARRDPRIRGIVAMAPLEWREGVRPLLTQMLDQHLAVKGIRRIVEIDANPQGADPVG